MPARINTILLTLLLRCTLANAQLSINGMAVCYDKINNKFLATLPSTMAGTDVQADISLGSEWSKLIINGENVTESYIFTNLNPNKTYFISIFDKNNFITVSTLSFTFLPIVKLEGKNIGYDYSQETILIIDPEKSKTDTLLAQIKWRGESTNTNNKHKRNYKLKLNNDQTLLGLRKDNNWILDAGQADIFRLRNRIANEIWNDFATKPYYYDREPDVLTGTRGKVVELFLGNEYRGVYCFGENIDRKQMKLKKIDKTTGQFRGLLWKSKEYSGNMYSQPDTVVNNQEYWNGFEAKYPDLQDADSVDFTTLHAAIDFVINSTDEEFSDSISYYFDLPVVLDYFLFVNLLGALDNRGKNMFWAVYDKTESTMLTPAVWDLDLTVGSHLLEQYGTGFSSPQYNVNTMGIKLIERLYELNVENFKEISTKRYLQLRQTTFSADSLKARYTYYYNLLKQSVADKREIARWSGDSDLYGATIDFGKELKYICEWIDQRLVHLDNSLFIESSVNFQVNETLQKQTIYNIRGQKMKNNKTLQPGIYIKNGKKFIIR